MTKMNHAMTPSALETISVLDTVCGGVHDPGKCADDVWPWAVGGAIAGALGGPPGVALGALGGGGAAVLASTNCGNGTDSPATLLRKNAGNVPKTYSKYAPGGTVGGK
jgi:hypothetical protein